jgi:hypothetical protein
MPPTLSMRMHLFQFEMNCLMLKTSSVSVEEAFCGTIDLSIPPQESSSTVRGKE